MLATVVELAAVPVGVVYVMAVPTSEVIAVPGTAATAAFAPVYCTPKRPKPENVTSAAATDAVATSAVVAKRNRFPASSP